MENINISNLEKAAYLNIPSLDIELFLYWTDSDNKMGYQLLYRTELIFEGIDFHPSPLFGLESLETCIDLLGFLSVQKGDADKEYFKDYNTIQLEFIDMPVCEQLKYLVCDIPDKENLFYEVC